MKAITMTVVLKQQPPLHNQTSLARILSLYQLRAEATNGKKSYHLRKWSTVNQSTQVLYLRQSRLSISDSASSFSTPVRSISPPGGKKIQNLTSQRKNTGNCDTRTISPKLFPHQKKNTKWFRHFLQTLNTSNQMCETGLLTFMWQ